MPTEPSTFPGSELPLSEQLTLAHQELRTLRARLESVPAQLELDRQAQQIAQQSQVIAEKSAQLLQAQQRVNDLEQVRELLTARVTAAEKPIAEQLDPLRREVDAYRIRWEQAEAALVAEKNKPLNSRVVEQLAKLGVEPIPMDRSGMSGPSIGKPTSYDEQVRIHKASKAAEGRPPMAP